MDIGGQTLPRGGALAFISCRQCQAISKNDPCIELECLGYLGNMNIDVIDARHKQERIDAKRTKAHQNYENRLISFPTNECATSSPGKSFASLGVVDEALCMDLWVSEDSVPLLKV